MCPCYRNYWHDYLVHAHIHWGSEHTNPWTKRRGIRNQKNKSSKFGLAYWSTNSSNSLFSPGRFKGSLPSYSSMKQSMLWMSKVMATRYPYSESRNIPGIWITCKFVPLSGILVIEVSLLLLRIFPAACYPALLVKPFEHLLHEVSTNTYRKFFIRSEAWSNASSDSKLTWAIQGLWLFFRDDWRPDKIDYIS